MQKLLLPWLISILVLALGLVTPEDASASKIYWTDIDTDKIQRASLAGSSVEDLVTSGLITPRGIALDLTGGKMYWADSGTCCAFDGKIQRADLDGSNVEDLITTGLSSPYGIALDLATPQSIPTLSVWGTLLLGSGLLALAAARRRAL